MMGGLARGGVSAVRGKRGMGCGAAGEVGEGLWDGAGSGGKVVGRRGK